MSAPRLRSPLPSSLLLLTFTTGLVDAVSWLALGHVFTALMTGNVVFLGLAAVGSGDLSPGRSLVALAAFAVGAAAGGRLHRALIGATHRAWISRAAAAEAAALVVAVVIAVATEPTTTADGGAGILGIIACTAVAMGVRSATVVRLRDPDLKTTVLTLTLTGLAADSRVAGGNSPRAKRRVAAVAALLAGAYAGAALLRVAGPALPLAATAVLVVVAAALYVRHPASVEARVE